MIKRLIGLLIPAIVLWGCSIKKRTITLTFYNNSVINKENQIVEIPLKDVESKLKRTTQENLILLNNENEQIPWQIVTNGTQTQKFIFPVSLKAGESKAFRITEGQPKLFAPLVYGLIGS